MKEDESTRGPSRPATLPEESSAEAKPVFEAAASRVAGFLTSFIRKKKTAPEKAPANQDGPARPDLFLDSKGKIVAAHPRSAGFFGRQPDELGGLNIKDLLKPGSDQEITNVLAKGKEASELTFHVQALRKDGSEFATKFSFRLLQDFRFRWAVFIQVPAGSSGGDQPVLEPKTIVPTTETATTETPEQLAAQSESSQNERKDSIQFQQDLSPKPKTDEHHPKRVETQQQAVNAPLRESATQSGDWEKRAANLKECVDELTRRHAREQNAAIKAAQRIKELEEQLKRAGYNHGVGNKDIAGQDDTRQFLKAEYRSLMEANAKARAELDKEREAIKVSRKKEEVLHTQIQTLQGTLEQAEARAQESAPQSKDWEKRAANLKECVDELTRRHAREQNAAIKAAQRVKELEEQLKRSGDDSTTGKKDIGDQDTTRQRLEAENRNLTEANAKARAELDKEREAIKVSRKKEEVLQTQVRALQGTLEQAEVRSRESALESKDWEKKAAELKKSVDELTQRHTAEADAVAKAAQRVKELEEQLKRAGDPPTAKAGADLDKESKAINVSCKKEEELQTQLRQLQGAFEKAEARARESEAQSRDWEKQAAHFKKSVDELTRSHASEQAATQRVKELEEQVKRAGNDQVPGNKDIEGQDDTRQFLKAENRDLTKASAKAKADLDKEREAFKKCVDELTRKHAAEQNAVAKAAQRVKELEEQLERAGDNQAASVDDIEGQEAARQLLEAEDQNPAEADVKAGPDLDKKSEAIKISRKKEEELQTQIQKLQGALEQAEARARENVAQSRDWEKQAAHFKKSVDEITRSHAAEQSAAAQRVKELEGQLKLAGNRAAGNEELEDRDDARQRLEAENGALTKAIAKAGAELGKEREAFRKCVDELTRKHSAERDAAVKAAQRVKELEEQLKRSGEEQAAGKKSIEGQDVVRQRLETENRNLIEANAKARTELDKERDAIKLAGKKEEELRAQVQQLQGAFEKAEAHARESAAQSKDWEKKAANLKECVDDLTRRHAAEQNAAVKAAQRVEELEEQVKRAGDDQAARKKDFEGQDATRQRLETEKRNLSEANAKAMAELDKEREAIKVSRKKEEELLTQIQTLQGTLDKAEAHARESAAQSKDWEKKATDLRKSVAELANSRAAEQSAAAQRVKELEEQLRRAGDDQATRKKDIEGQDATRLRLETENRNLSEANAKAMAELDKEREAIKVSRKKEEELQTQIQKLQGAFEKAEAGARESAAQSKDWEKKAADLKKSIDELIESHAAEQSTAEKRVWELEAQLKRAGEDLATSRAENGNLTESTEMQAALEKKAVELEERVRRSALSLAKADAELERQRTERERAEKSALSAAAQIEKLEEKLKRQVDFERASLSKIEELERTLLDRGDDLARAYAALRIEVKERQAAEKQSRLASEMGNRPESNQASFEDRKKAFEASPEEKNERLEVVECSLAEAEPRLEDESTERHRVEELLAEARQQREKLSAEIFLKASRMYRDGLYSECLELTKELMRILDEKIPIFNNAWNLHIYTLTNLGLYEEAKTDVQRRIKAIEDRLGKKHPSLMSPLKNLAAILDRTGFVFEAEQAMRRVSSIAEKSPSVDDVEFGTYLNNLSRRAGTKRPNAV